MPLRAVTFDFGETLATLDEQALAAKVARHGVALEPARILAALPRAWETYQRPAASGSADEGGGHHPWKPLMAELLTLAGASHPERHAELVDWLFEDQKRANLWRKPIAGMIELVRELTARGVRVGVLSNSEGHLDALVRELDWTRELPIVIDSGRVGVAKPDPAIFRLAAEALGVALDEVVHVGDSLRADVRGALDAGAQALWLTTPPAYPERPTAPPPGVAVCVSADEARAAIFGALRLA